ncbi:uncharacterized protein [Ptychodera flava]|uniref:uncharacterized protein n=1 Tax=Ptychodera flava TaxID=63121 RepID=UPI003969C253
MRDLPSEVTPIPVLDDHNLGCQETAIKFDDEGFGADEFYVEYSGKMYQYDPNIINDDDFRNLLAAQENERCFRTLSDELAAPGTLPQGWNTAICADKIYIVHLSFSDKFPVISKSVKINSDLSIAITVHGQQLHPDHPIFNKCFIKSKQHILRFLSELDKFNICCGNFDEDFLELVPSVTVLSHAGQKAISAFREGNFCAISTDGVRYETTIRSVECSLLTNGTRCHSCSKYRGTLRSMRSRNTRSHLKDRISTQSRVAYTNLNKDELCGRLRHTKAQLKLLQARDKRIKGYLQETIKDCGIELNSDTSSDIASMMTENTSYVISNYKPDTFERLFWEEQLKANACKSPKRMRWHPMIIRLCLSLHLKSPSAYKTMRESGFIKLPCKRTLYDYSHCVKGISDFSPEVTRQLLREMKLTMLEEWQRYVVLLQDEIRIKEDLVYDKHSGELIGFVNLDSVGNDLLNYQERIQASFDSSTADSNLRLARYMLCLMVRGIATNFKFAFAHFPTYGITADELFSIMWRGVEYLEQAGVMVLATTCDGASPNRKFFKLHRQHNAPRDTLVYSTVNPFASEPRKLFFISDPPHLIKTARNCFANSYSHKRSRRMWRNHKDISWLHIVNLYEQQSAGLYRTVMKLTRSHVHLTSFSVMRVNLAAQVLSRSVANAIEASGCQQVTETVKFIRMFNKFFDCLNVRSINECTRTGNPDVRPYTDVNDPRFEWLQNDFLQYFAEWKEQVDNRQGVFTRKEKGQMMLSYQTLQGIEITVRSFVEACKFLLQQGAQFVLSEHFSQDPLEQWFGKQRQAGGWNENPTVQEFDYNTVNLRVQGSSLTAPVTGNTNMHREAMQFANDTPLEKRPRIS